MKIDFFVITVKRNNNGNGKEYSQSHYVVCRVVIPWRLNSLKFFVSSFLNIAVTTFLSLLELTI